MKLHDLLGAQRRLLQQRAWRLQLRRRHGGPEDSPALGLPHTHVGLKQGGAVRGPARVAASGGKQEEDGESELHDAVATCRAFGQMAVA